MLLTYHLIRGLRTSVLIFVLLVIVPNYGWTQQFYSGSVASVTLSNYDESQLSDYTVTCFGASDAGTGNSLIPAGLLGQINFPANTDVSACSGATITVLGTTYTISSYAEVQGSPAIQFTIPASVPSQTGFTLHFQNIKNPPINPACGATGNTYVSSSPCNQGVSVTMENITHPPIPVFGLGSNSYTHSVGLYTIDPIPYQIEEIVEEKYFSQNAVMGTAENEAVRINVKVIGSQGTLPTMTNASFNLANTTNSSIINAAKLFSTDAVNYFHTTGEVQLGTATSPSGTMAFSFSKQLSPGDNFFFLTYDLDCANSFIGNSLDGGLNTVTVDATAYPPNTIAPEFRTLVLDYSNFTGPNLVPNPDFESYAVCPTSFNTHLYSFPDLGVPGWHSPTYGTAIVSGTSDYFHTCDAGNIVGVPQNFAGTQPARSGSAYAGIGYLDDNNNEYLQIQLSSPLVAGQEYAVNFFVSLAETQSGAARNGLGAYLSTTQVVPSAAGTLPYTAQVIDMGVIEDEEDWQPIGGTFTAAGGEEWLIIGNFLDANSITLVEFGEAYYYVDDVSLTPASNLVDCPSILGVELYEFDVKAFQSEAVVQWSTLAQNNCDYFTLLRSEDMLSWEEITTVTGEGTTQSFTEYTVRDLPKCTTCYYRLMQTDHDGTINELGIRHVLFRPISSTVQPNPFEKHLAINYLSTAPLSIRVLDLNGVEKRTFPAPCPSLLNLETLPSGVYFLEITYNDSKEYTRIIKQ